MSVLLLLVGARHIKLVEGICQFRVLTRFLGFKPSGEDEKRVFMTAVALGFNGTYNRSVNVISALTGFSWCVRLCFLISTALLCRLYTLTAQCLKKDLPRVGQSLHNVVASFTPPNPVM